MVALIILGVIALIVALILTLHVTVCFTYREEVGLAVKVFGIKIKILPSKPKKKKKVGGMSAKQVAKKQKKLDEKAAEKARKKAEKKKEKEYKKAHPEPKEPKPKKPISEWMDDIRYYLHIAGKFLKKFAGSFRIRVCRMRITCASDDAATTAMMYGGICGAMNLFLPVLEKAKAFPGLDNADIHVGIDYLSTDFAADLDLRVTVNVGKIIRAAFAAGVPFIIYFLKDRKKQSDRQKMLDEAEAERKEAAIAKAKAKEKAAKTADDASEGPAESPVA